MLMTLIVARVAFSMPAPPIEEVAARFEQEAISWNPVGQVNWPEFPARPEVRFRIMHSEYEIYLQFNVCQEGLTATFDYDYGSDPYKDDCVEFFMVPSPADPSYFNLEMNCIGHGTFDYGPLGGERVHSDDSVISQIRRLSSLGSEAFGRREGMHEWTLTVAIPKRLYALIDKDLPGFSGRTVKANFYKCGDNTAVPHYLSWNPVVWPEPSFHRPECFGDLYFE